MFKIGDKVQTSYGPGTITGFEILPDSTTGEVRFTVEVLSAHMGLFSVYMTTSELEAANPLPIGTCPILAWEPPKCECGQSGYAGLIKHSDYCPLYSKY